MSEDAEVERRTQAMRLLDDGLNQLERKYAPSVILLYEDPETFGAGHFVLYPLMGSTSRFTVEEQYPAGTDWSDDDRVPTSWLWRAEHIGRDSDGSRDWQLEAAGEAFPDDLPRLLGEAEKWVRRTHNRALQTEQFRTPTRSTSQEPPTRRL